MTKKIVLSAIAASVMASSVMATNGDVMIGQSAQSRAMGGVGIATSFGADSGLANPALLSTVEKSHFTGTLTTFMPDVNFASNAGASAQNFDGGGNFLGAATMPTQVQSGADLSFIPEFAYASRVNKNLVYGVSLTGTAGMGVDYEGASNGAFGMTTNLMIAKIAVPVSYKVNKELSVGVTPVIQYGSLQMNYNPGSGQTTAGAETDTGFGFELGASYEATKELTVGAVYKSAIAMEYDNQIARAATDFSMTVGSGNKLEQPSEYGLGASYKMGASTIALDYKMINWGDTEGYGDFGWENQNVIALGYAYQAKGWAVRAGYNYAKNPIEEQNGAVGFNADGSITNYNGAAINFFNLAGFPGVVESHLTVGGSYEVSKGFGIDLAVIYAPEVTLSYDTSAMTAGLAYSGTIAQGGSAAQAAAAAQAITDGASTAEVAHSQMGITIAANYKF